LSLHWQQTYIELAAIISAALAANISAALAVSIRTAVGTNIPAAQTEKSSVALAFSNNTAREASICSARPWKQVFEHHATERRYSQITGRQ
jgi:hypothetical protein